MKIRKLLLAAVFCSTYSFAQVGVGTTAPQGALDVTSTTDGFVPPRIALANTTTATVTTPTTSELVYNTATAGDVTPGYYYWDGTKWVRLLNTQNNDWSLIGNSGTMAGTNFLGTTDVQDLRFKTNSTDRLNISNATGQIQAYSAGTVATPAFSWNGDSNTGMYQGGSDVLGFSTNGIERVKMNNSETVVNDGSNDYDFRIETNNNEYGLLSDASQDAVIFGSTGNLYNDGTTFTTAVNGYSTTIDYVADFDKGTSRGTTLGLGSIEYLVDGEAELFISDSFSPTAHLTYDLGYENAWDDIYADDYWNYSDIRAKKDIKPMKYGLNEIMKLNTISYKLKDDPFQDNKIGLIAQEVNKLVPEASKTEDYKKNEKGEFKKVQLDKIRVSYVNLVPVLVKSIQEQQDMIKSLEAKLKKLETALKTAIK